MSNIMGTKYLAQATVDLTGLSNNPARRGDYIGFTFDGTHSSELGIVRVSDGSRFQETLLPEFSNKTVNVPGSNRTDYMGMEYTQKPINLSIAFDSVTEKQLRDIKRIFSTTVPKSLVFDETPYKTYYVKASAPPTFTYLCFDETQQVGEPRIYKGEGTIHLISFFPYGFCNPRELESKGLFDSTKYPNCNEWLEASGLDKIKKYGLGDLVVYNPGDYETPFWIEIEGSSLPEGGFYFNNDIFLKWRASSIENDNLPKDSKIIVDGRTQLIEGYDSKGKKTGRIYNKFITEGNWFNLPITGKLMHGISGNDIVKKINYNILYI